MNRLLLLALLALPLNGCMSAELARVRRDVGRDLPQARLADSHALAFGRLSMWLARSVAGADDESLRLALRHVRSASVGRYPVRGAFDAPHVALTQTVAQAARRGWTPTVVAREDSSATWVLSRERRDGSLSDLLVVALSPKELTLVRVQGRLDAAALTLLAQGATGNVRSPLESVIGPRRPRRTTAP